MPGHLRAFCARRPPSLANSDVKWLMFCPNCSTPLKTPGASSCVNCGALFGEGSAWTAVESPSVEDGKGKPLGLARSGLALLLIFICVCFLSVSLALKGSAIGSTPPLILAVVFGSTGCVVVMGKSSRARTAATLFGLLMFVALVWIIGTVLSRFPP